jgi:hypothetical protein
MDDIVISVQSLLTYMIFNETKRISFYFLYDLYGSNLFNHEERKVLRQAQDNSTKVHKVNILNVLINLSELELSEATFLYFLI